MIFPTLELRVDSRPLFECGPTARNVVDESTKRPSARRPREREFQPENGNYFRFRPVLTEAQSQDTKVTSTVARDGKKEGGSMLFRQAIEIMLESKIQGMPFFGPIPSVSSRHSPPENVVYF